VRTPGLTPLFQAALTYLASPLAAAPMPGLAVELLDVEVAVAKFDLTLSAYESDGRLSGWVEYRTGLFDAATVERWMGSLRTLLEAAAGDPDQRLSELPLLSAAERWQLVGEHNDTEAPPLSPALAVHERFAAQAARAPGARVAVGLGRSPDLIVSLLAVLKAGGACVPLDPAHASERLELMLADAA